MTQENNSPLEKSISPLLPRSAWNSRLKRFQVLLKAKMAIDRAEAMEATKY